MDRTKKSAKRTIVGGRPRGRAAGYVEIPRGIEVLTKKASVDPTFRQALLDRRAEAAREIELELTPAERAMLEAIPEAQLKRIIEETVVPDPQRRAFLGQAAAVMLSAIASSCKPPTPTSEVVEGIRPDPEDTVTPTPREVEKGIRPDRPQ